MYRDSSPWYLSIALKRSFTSAFNLKNKRTLLPPRRLDFLVVTADLPYP
jgi:hypothetical protein